MFDPKIFAVISRVDNHIVFLSFSWTNANDYAHQKNTETDTANWALIVLPLEEEIPCPSSS